MTQEPWYKRWWLAIVAGLGMVLAGIALAVTGGSKGKRVGQLEKKLRDIHEDELKEQLEESRKLTDNLAQEKEELRRVAEQAHNKLDSAPKYDPSKSDKENLESFKSSGW